jgi:hypothetical protein
VRHDVRAHVSESDQLLGQLVWWQLEAELQRERSSLAEGGDEPLQRGGHRRDDQEGALGVAQAAHRVGPASHQLGGRAYPLDG